jgi:flagellar hook-basal body complex protein FliE
MMDGMRIDPLSLRQAPEVAVPQLRTAASVRGSGESPSFREVLSDAISEVQRLQTEADATIKKLVSGEITDAAEAMVAVQKADIAFQTMMTVRGKVMSAYEEIMRMQI